MLSQDEAIRGGASSAKGNLETKGNYAGRGRRVHKFFLFFRSAVVALLRREVDVTLAICFCVFSALTVTFNGLQK